MNQIRVAGRLRVVPIFPLEFVELRKDIANVGARNPCGFRAPTFALSFRCSTNSRGKTGTARSLCSWFCDVTFNPGFKKQKQSCQLDVKR